MEKLNTRKADGEDRGEQAEKVLKFLDRIDAFAYAKSLLNEQGEAEKPNFKEFEDFLIRLNGIARNISIHKRTVDGAEVQLSGFVETVELPRSEDKEGLLRYAYEKGKTMETGDLKYLLPSVINAVHLFADGNGRTSRIIHLLLREYATKEEFDSELRKALNEYGRFDSYDINPGFIGHELMQEVLKKHGWIFNKEHPYGTHEYIKGGIASVEIRGPNKEIIPNELAGKLFDLSADNGYYVVTAVYMELGEEIQNFMSEYGNDKELRISPKKMLKILHPEQWQKILGIFYELKKEQVETLVDVFVNPERCLVSEGDGVTLRDMFIREIQKNKEQNAQ